MANKEFDKLPPQSIEAEQSVLGSLLLDKKAVVKIADILKPDDFYRDVHKIIFETMLELFEKNEPIDIMSVSNRLEEKELLEKIGGSAYLTELVNFVPTAANVVHYAKLVQKKKMLRDLIEAAHDITQLSYQEAEDIERVLDQAEKNIFAVSQRSVKQFFIPIKPALEEAFERIDALHKHEGGTLRGIPTGFSDLDNLLAGLQKSDYIILAARPSLGKTTLALDIARNIATKEKVPVGLFSLEMSAPQVVDRLLCAQANIDLWRLRTGRLSAKGKENDFTKIQEAIGILSESPIYIDDSAASTVMEIRTKARRLQAEHGLGLIIVDYIQLINPLSPRESAVQQMTEISRFLKALARELDVPLIAISQLSRAAEQRSPRIPRMADLRESGCLMGDTLITKADTGERIPIKTLAKRKEQIPIPIMAIDENLKISPRIMRKVFPSGKKRIFELKTRSGRIIKASANHPFLKLEGWKRLDQLKIDDFIALPRNFSPQKPLNPLSSKELILLGHLLGDGCILPRQPYHYTSADKKNIEIVKKTASKLFNIKSKIVKQKNWYHVYLTTPYHLTHKKYHPITNWFNKIGIERVRSWQKRIPDAVFECDQKKIALFLKHLWATDGNLSWKKLPKRKPAGNIYYATSSENLARQVQHLLLRLDIQCSIREIPSSKNYRTMYHIHIEGADEQLKFLSKIGIAGEKAKIVPVLKSALEKIITNTNIDIIPKEAWAFAVAPAKEKLGIGWREVHKSINTAYCGSSIFKSGIGRGRMQKLYNALKDPFLQKLATSDIFWDKIISIKKLGIEKVYDATVDDVHNFVANDIIVHNSLEQDADVVLLIYREDMDLKQSERKNIADIIIAKHRNGPIGQIELYFDSSCISFRSLEKKHKE